MSSTIGNLWVAGNLPIKDGLYRVDGPARALYLDSASGRGFRLLELFDIDDLMYDSGPENVTCIDVTLEQRLADDSGYLCCGEGSCGSEGFVARLDMNRNLVWVIYLENANPFVQIEVHGSEATVFSSSGLSLRVDLLSPEFGPAVV